MASYTWDSPRCFIDNSDQTGLQVNEETLKLLRQVRVPVTVVAIVGLYRTGKSYLMNILAGAKTGFDLGSTVQAKTKGIWAWCRPHPKNPDHCLLLLDSEGLGDPEKGDKNHDTWIFALAVLLSSTLVYNSMGTINQDALDDLHCVTKISEHITIRSKSEDEDGLEFDGFFPNFIWAVRDFTLELELDGTPCTPNQYLENALKRKPGISPKIASYNLPRDCLKNYFPSRKCFVFPQPVNDRKDLKNLEKLPNDKLDGEFRDVSAVFTEYVIKTSRAKSVQGVTMTGSALANLAHCYVSAIQNGAVPCVENAVETMAQIENAKAMEDSLKLYRNLMSEKAHLPTSTLEELSKLHQECEMRAIAAFMTASIFDNGQYQSNMAESIQNLYKEFCKENEHASKTKSESIIRELYSPISKKLQSGQYAQPGGFEMYKQDMDQLQTKYNSTTGKGIKAADVLKVFMESKASEHSSILASDKKLTELQKKAAEEKRTADEAKIKEAAAVEESKQMQQRILDQQKSHEENVRQLQIKMDEERDALLAELREQLDKKMKEQEDLLRNGFKDEADALKSQIEQLEAQIREGLFTRVGKFFDNFFTKIAKTVEK